MHEPSYIGHPRLKTVTVVAPEAFTLLLGPRRPKLLKFLARLRQLCALGRRVKLDFSRVTTLHPCGTLLFVSELYRLLEMSSLRASVRCNYPTDAVVEQLFQHIGLLERLGLSPRAKISHEKVKDWTFQKGTDVNLDGIERLNDRLQGDLGEELTFGLLSGIKEAVTNAVHHAYIGERGDGVDEEHRGWWLFTQHKDGQIDISICDLGVGIKRSLPRTGTWSQQLVDYALDAVASKTKEAKYIAAALELGRTRTGESNRGKGLHEMLQLVKDAKAGSLYIYSNTGVYACNASGKVHIEDAPESILGTLVQWSFKVSDFAERA